MTGRKYIKLRMVGEDCEEMHFNVKKTTPLNKLMRRYSESKGVAVTSLRFFFDGFRIGDSETVEDLEFVDPENDKIEVFTELGGNKRDAEEVVDLTENEEAELFTGLGGNMRDTGEVVKGQGEDDAEKTKSSKLVFCHLEFLRSTTSHNLHLTQLAAVSTDDHSPLFLPVFPPVLAEYLDDYKLSGDLMQALTMTRDMEDKNIFLFRPTVLVEEVPRVACVTEEEALVSFLKFLEDLGPNIILVGLDEDTLGVLMQKLKSQDRARFLEQVDGFTWWRRILKHSGLKDYKDLGLKEFYNFAFSPPPEPHLTCAMVAERLKQAVKEVACRQGFSSMSGGKFASAVALPVQTRPRMEQREVAKDAEEVLEVVNSYLSIPVTSFTVRRMEQVDVDQDESSGAHLNLCEVESMGAVVKKEDPIYIISSDSDSEDLTQPPPQPCCSTTPSSNLPTRPLCTPVPADLCEDPQLLSTAISDQPPSKSSCWQVVKTYIGVYVACPVCKVQVKPGLLLEHMGRHQQQTSEWNQSRPCQLCVDQGHYTRRVFPSRMGFHILYRHSHRLNGHLPSPPAPQPPTRATAATPPGQLNPAAHPMSTTAPAPNFWRFIKTNGVQLVICPLLKQAGHLPPTKTGCCVKPQNLANHMQRVHQVDPESPQYRQQCQGCKLTVPPGEVSAHIVCHRPSSPCLPNSSCLPRYLGPTLAQDPEWTSWIKRVQLKRKSTTSVRA